jgi:hypothetical protein
MRRCVLAAVVLAIAGMASSSCSKGSDDATIFQATLTGSGEVPARGTAAEGAVGLTVIGNTVQYSIEVHGITSVVGSHIHSGAAGVNGPIRIALYPRPGANFGPATSSVDGVLIQGTFQASDVVGITFDQLLSEMRAGTAYANVHTTQFPGGEIRGQVRLVQ